MALTISPLLQSSNPYTTPTNTSLLFLSHHFHQQINFIICFTIIPMDEIEVPLFFVCPISLEMMKDPVTIATGITYDRENIEKWIFTEKNNFCPVTKQVLSKPADLTPNHTLRRVIQSWCTLNASNGIERVPTPKPPVNKSQIIKLLNDAKSPQMQMKCLKRLRSIASTSETNKRCIESSGAVDFLASLVKNTNNTVGACDEALSVLFSLQLSESALKSFTFVKNGEFFESLLKVLQAGCYESRAYAVLLLNNILEVEEPMKLVALKPEFFVELVQILHDQISPKASKAALQLLINVGQWGRNRVKAAEAGAVKVLVDLLLDSSNEKRVCEMILTALDQLCQCAVGRAELLKHGAGLAVVSKKILRVSKVGTERAVRILLSIAKYSGSAMVVQEMLQLGVVTKLCLVLQVDSGSKAKERAREILQLHARVWKNSNCISMNLVSSYP